MLPFIPSTKRNYRVLSSHLRLCDIEQLRHFRAFRRGKVLLHLELFLQLEDLTACESSAGLLPFPLTIRTMATVTEGPTLRVRHGARRRRILLFRCRRLLLAFRRRLGPCCSVCGENNVP